MRIAHGGLALLLLVGASVAQTQSSRDDAQVLAARVERLEKRLARLEGRQMSAGGMFRIVTENKNREAVEKLLKERFSGFTLYEARGHFKGAEQWYDESSLVIEIVGTSRAEVESVACSIRHLNGQEAVLVEEVPVRNLLLGPAGASNGKRPSGNGKKDAGTLATRSCPIRPPAK